MTAQNDQKRQNKDTFLHASLPPEFPIQVLHTENPETANPLLRRPHVHDCLEIGICDIGHGIFSINESLAPFHSGDIAVITGKAIHFAQNQRGTQTSWTWLLLDPPGLQLLARAVSLDLRVQINGIFAGSDHPDLAHLVRAIQREMEQKGHAFQTAVRGLVAALVVCLHRLEQWDTGKTVPAPLESLEKMRPAIHFIREHYAHTINLDNLAKACNMNTSNFRQQFKLIIGKSPYQYMLEYRIGMASIELKNTSKSIADIARENGFPTLSSFNRKFRLAMGMTPKDWRKKK